VNLLDLLDVDRIHVIGQNHKVVLTNLDPI